MLPLSQRVENAIAAMDGLPGVIAKLDIGTSSIYVQLCWLDGNVARIDITLSRGGGTPFDSLPKSEAQANLEHENYSLARSWVEDSCKMATKLFGLGEDIISVVSEWKGVRGYPSGVCPQLECIVPGPLHAAAVLIENRFEEWTAELTNQ
ncbi:MAG: hypothetical protein JW704_09820 [Anaerolineaceae bacterium]|nr:hypothetical protein [Anaerolineaceae bacterium]